MKAGLGKLALLAALAGALPCLVVPVRNPDLYWHLSAARAMVESRTIPRADFLSWTMAGQPWLDFEWLTQLVYFCVERAAGCAGLVALRAAALLGVLAAAAGLAALGGAGEAAGLCVLMTVCALFPFADLRPDNFSLLFFALLFYALEALRRGRLRATPGVYAAATALFSLWSNMHLGLAFGLALLVLTTAGEALDALRPALEGRPTGSLLRAGELATLTGAAALGTLANPYTWRLYAVIRQHAAFLRTLAGVICEWKPPDFSAYWLWPYTALLLLALVALLWHFLATKRTPFALLLPVCYFGLASSLSQRHLSYFCVLAAPVLLWLLRDLASGPRARRALPWVAGAAFAALLGYVVRVAAPMLGRDLCADAPRALADFLVAHADILGGKTLYNTWEDGGYLGWRLYPTYRVFYDGRYIFHPFIERVIEAAKSAETWRAYSAGKGLQLCSMRRSHKNIRIERLSFPGGQAAVVERPYYESYLPVSDWAVIYWDDRRVLLVLRKLVPQPWLRAHEYHYIRPDDDGWLKEKAAHGRIPTAVAQAELARHRSETAGVDAAAESARLEGFLKGRGS